MLQNLFWVFVIDVHINGHCQSVEIGGTRRVRLIGNDCCVINGHSKKDFLLGIFGGFSRPVWWPPIPWERCPVAIARVKNVIWCHVPLHFIIIIALCHHHWSSSSATKKISPESSSLRLPSSQTSCQDRTSVGSEPGKYGKYHYPHIKVTVRRKKGKTKVYRYLTNEKSDLQNVIFLHRSFLSNWIYTDISVISVTFCNSDGELDALSRSRQGRWEEEIMLICHIHSLHCPFNGILDILKFLNQKSSAEAC